MQETSVGVCKRVPTGLGGRPARGPESRRGPCHSGVWGAAPSLIAMRALARARCQSLGSGRVPRERLGYAGAIAESWKELMLLNIVKQRYLDMPVYLDVSSVISSYSRE